MKKVVWIVVLSGCMGLLAVSAQAQNVERSPGMFTQPVDTALKVTVVDNRITVANAPVKSKIEIYNILGSKVKEFEIKQSTDDYIAALPKGYYIVRIKETVRKIIIR
ncbi:MAG: T9SS type A sorting domain-containing protein [Tannerella sp.]|jgi:hypothetical protein|nr:T9SS type A sorting domain-containing protein [Tannerella sp.]